MHAEQAYLFRHALLRDVAYQMQMPEHRARLHELAFRLIEEAFGGRAPKLPPPGTIDPPPFRLHATDGVAEELVEHAEQAMVNDKAQVAAVGAAGRLYLHRAAELAEKGFRTGSAFCCWEKLGQSATGTEKAECLRRAAVAAINLGHAKRAEELLDDTIRILRATGDRRLTGMALSNLASLYRETGRQDHAERTYFEALDIHQEVGHESAVGSALTNLAGVYQLTGRLDRAEEMYKRGLEIHRQNTDRWSEGTALTNLAGVFQLSARLELAEETYEQALEIHREVGNRRFEGITLTNLASAYQTTQRMELAERTNELALTLHRELGNRRFEGVSLGNLAITYLETGRLERARLTFEHALDIHREVCHRHFEGVHLCDYSSCLLGLGLVDEAANAWREASTILSEVGDAGMLAHKAAAMRLACEKAGIEPFAVPGEDQAQQPAGR